MLDPAIEFGQGSQFFEPIADGATILIVLGPQGSYHFDGSMRVQGVNPGNADDLSDPSNPTTRFTAMDGTNEVAFVEYVQGVKPSPGQNGVYDMVGRRLFLTIGDDSELDGHEVVLTVEFEDVDGMKLSDSRTLIAEPHPLNGR